VELSRLSKDPAFADTRIVAIAIDSRPDLEKMYDTVLKKNGEPPNVIFLSDPEHSVIHRYGILNERSQGLPHPATFVIDREGIVRWKSVNVDYRQRPADRQILEALEDLP
jgi:peroxiredoxin